MGVTDAVFSSDSTKIAFGCDNGVVGIFNVKTKKIEHSFTDHQEDSEVIAVSFNKADTQIASATKQGEIIVRNYLASPPKSFSFREDSVTNSLVLSI